MSSQIHNNNRQNRSQRSNARQTWVIARGNSSPTVIGNPNINPPLPTVIGNHYSNPILGLNNLNQDLGGSGLSEGVGVQESTRRRQRGLGRSYRSKNEGSSSSIHVSESGGNPSGVDVNPVLSFESNRHDESNLAGAVVEESGGGQRGGNGSGNGSNVRSGWDSDDGEKGGVLSVLESKLEGGREGSGRGGSVRSGWDSDDGEKGGVSSFAQSNYGRPSVIEPNVERNQCNESSGEQKVQVNERRRQRGGNGVTIGRWSQDSGVKNVGGDRGGSSETHVYQGNSNPGYVLETGLASTTNQNYGGNMEEGRSVGVHPGSSSNQQLTVPLQESRRHRGGNGGRWSSNAKMVGGDAGGSNAWSSDLIIGGNGGEQSRAAPLQDNSRQRGGNGGNIGRPSYSQRGLNVKNVGGEQGGSSGSYVYHDWQRVRSKNEGLSQGSGQGFLGAKQNAGSSSGIKGGDSQGGSNVPQLVQEIQEKLTKGTVECMICYDMVRRTAPIWSCSSCYSIFHLNCIKKWARAPTSSDFSAEKNQGLNWRCPGCQSVQLVSAKEIRYVCFCLKRPDPPSDLYLTPHSCGEPCGKPLDKEFHENDISDGEREGGDHCPHNCVLQCHPGPCPPCKAFAPPRSCPCGKKMMTGRCSDRKSVFTCGHRCDKVLECGRHQCGRVCHSGPCDSCSALINAECFCKKKSEAILCGEMTVKGQVKEEDGVFSCSEICEKNLACGNHVCGDVCHPGPCGECELTPGVIKSCYCGKTRLQHERQSCLDLIPTCFNICDKVLPCGIHRCKDVCHAGDCSKCMIIVRQSCRCGSSSRMVECFRTFDEHEKFVCEKSCGQKKNCGRHRCSERCCPLSNSRNQSSSNWDLHLCSIGCGKKLRCGQHSCESLCHSGYCPPCLETIFTDLTCACGRTSIPPPLPCGTPPPSCMLPCLVPRPCGHTSSHSCHFGDCPPCPVPVAKECVGGHVFLRNIPCGSKDIRCNQFCGKTRQCGVHACARICHPPPCNSSCTSASISKASCGQICGAPRTDCKHTCKSTCHLSAICPDVRCDFPVMITCSCGRITATVPCDAGGSSHVDTIFEASVIQKLSVPLQPVEANGIKVPLGQRKLVCDEECAKVERKRVLADAFDITSSSSDSLHFGENSGFPDSFNDLFRRESKWVFSIEERLKFLFYGKGKVSTATGLKVHVFSPMLKDKRDAVRQIAERWKLSVHAAGWEPKRFLVVHVTPKSKTPTRFLLPKGALLNASHQPVFDPLVDMDPRLVVALLDLPRDADISALVLRFGGECELVWLNDKNALAVFSDPTRAATALRRLDNGSAYHGATAFIQNGAASSVNNAWGGNSAVINKEGPWKKAAVQEETGWRDDSWGAGDWSAGSVHMQVPGWRGKQAPIPASINRYNVLDSDSVSKQPVESSAGVVTLGPQHYVANPSVAEMELKVGIPSSSSDQIGESSSVVESKEVVDDWEEAYK